MTISLALVGIALVLSLKPVKGLAVYLVLAVWYPYAVGTLKLGTIDFSVGRVVIIVLLLKLLSDKNLTSNFRWIWADSLILILFAAEIVAGLFNVNPAELIEYRGGDFFDMALPYFAVRLVITTKSRYLTFLKALAWTAGILGLFAFYESVTGHNLLALGRNLTTPGIRMRYFHRAKTTFRICIYYGVFSAMAATMCIGLFKNLKGNKTVYKILFAAMALGCFSSMSSGGLLAMIGGLMFIGFYKYRHQWKTAIIAIVMMCAVVEVISNRHFYDVVDRIAFNSATAWYRARLFEVAFFEGGMSGHWLVGFGCFTDPGWGAKIDYRAHTDMVNHYLLKLTRYGLVGFIPFMAVIVLAVKNLFKNFWLHTKDEDRWLVWCLAASLFSVLFAFNSVSLFGQPMILLFMIFGLCVMVPRITLSRCLGGRQ